MAYAPEFDYDPNSEEALRAAQTPVAPASDYAMLPSVDDPGDMYTEPTQSDYAAELERTTRNAGVDATLMDEVARYDAEQAAAEDAAMQANLAYQQTPQGQTMGGAGQARANADAYGNALLQQVSSPSRPNPVAPIRQEHAQNYMALAGAQHEARNQTAQAAIYQQSAEADAYEREAGRQQAQIDAQQAKLIRDQQRRDMAMEAERHVFEQIQNASDKLAKTPDDDRGRYWASRKWWQKFAWAISAIADGMRGLDPMAALNSAIEGDIRDQQSAREARRGELASAQEQLGAVRSIYADLRSTIGDEDTTHDAMRLARYEQAKALLMAEQLRNGIPLQAAMANEGILELDQKINDTAAAIRERLAVTPERIGGGTRPALTGPIRSTVEKMRAEEAARATKLEQQGIDIGAEQQKQERGAQLDVQKEEAKARAAGAAKQGEADVEMRKKILENSKDWGLVEQMIDDWEQRNTGNIHGTGMPLTGTREQRIENDSFDTLLPQMAIKAITGANFSEAQGKAAYRLTEGTWDEMTDDAKRARVRALKNLASAQRRYAARLLGEDPGAEPLNRQPVMQSPEGLSTFEPE